MNGFDESLLSAYADGECTPAERELVESRLAADETARQIHDDVVAARDLVRALAWREPPAGFVDALLTAPAEDPTSRARGAWRRGAVVASAAAAVVIGFALATPDRPGTSVEPELATVVEAHGGTASFRADPVSALAPVVVPTGAEP